MCNFQLGVNIKSELLSLNQPATLKKKGLMYV